MASYFRQVPNFDYISRNPGEKYISEYIAVKNFFKRGKIRDDIFENLQFFEKYSIVGDERPDNVASKFYGDDTLDWIILIIFIMGFITMKQKKLKTHWELLF